MSIFTASTVEAKMDKCPLRVSTMDVVIVDMWMERLARVQKAVEDADLPRGVAADIHYQNGRPVAIIIAGDWNRPRKRKAKP